MKKNSVYHEYDNGGLGTTNTDHGHISFISSLGEVL